MRDTLLGCNAGLISTKYTVHIRLSMFKVEGIEANRVFGGFLVQAHCMLVTVDCTEVVHEASLIDTQIGERKAKQ